MADCRKSFICGVGTCNVSLFRETTIQMAAPPDATAAV
jgi:hypothetical protein